MVPLSTILSSSWVKGCIKLASDGICQFKMVILSEWNVITNTQYFGPKFGRIDIIICSSFFSIPHYLSSTTKNLNLVKNSYKMVSKWGGIKVMSSFSRWCPLSSFFFPKRASSLIQYSFGVDKISIWNKRSLEMLRHSIPKASSSLLNYFDFSTAEFGSTSIPMVTL